MYHQCRTVVYPKQLQREVLEGRSTNIASAIKTEASGQAPTLMSVQFMSAFEVFHILLFHIFSVQVLDVVPKEGSSAFHSVHVKYMDEGRSGQVQNYHLLLLPEQFQLLSPQAKEFIVCRVKPTDNEVEWNPKVSCLLF